MNLKLLFVLLIIYDVAAPSKGQVHSPIKTDDVPVPKEDFKNFDGKEKINQSTSLTIRSGPTDGLASRFSQLEAEFREKIEEIKTQTSRSNKDQDEKIAIIRANEQNLAQLLNQTREEMIGLKTQNNDQSKRIDQLEKQLAMLQNTPPTPSALTRGNNNDKMKNIVSNSNDGQISKALTPPSSCEDLAMLDYYLDGLYMVKCKQTKKIKTVFCKFSANDKVVQETIGTVDIKTKTVHFYVQRKSGFGFNGIVPFEFARLNEGGAFNVTSGIFTVPVPGIYHFDLSAVKNPNATFWGIHLQVNGANVGRSVINQSAKGNVDGISLSASLRLSADDKVNLWNTGPIHDNINRMTHFSGWIVEEDLM